MKNISAKRIILCLLFTACICLLAEACSSGRKGYKVRSGSGMGNPKHKNRHVWGK